MGSSAGARAVATCARFLIFSVTLAICHAAQADTAPHPARDINQVHIPESSAPEYLGSLNGRVLLGARDSEGAGLSVDGRNRGRQRGSSVASTCLLSGIFRARHCSSSRVDAAFLFG